MRSYGLSVFALALAAVVVAPQSMAEEIPLENLRVPDGFAYQACRIGIGHADISGLASGCFVRVARRSIVNERPVGYIGLARYRHLEDDDE